LVEASHELLLQDGILTTNFVGSEQVTAISDS
jgi:hypothetical protein